MNGDRTGTFGAADSSFGPREAAWFRTRLALRLAVPLDRDARLASLKVACSAMLAAPPVTILLIAPADRLTLGTVAGLCCAGLPGFTASAWAAAGLRDTRHLAAHGLRQAGAEQRIAWLLAAMRLALFAGVGALAGGLLVALLRAPLGAALPQYSPLHGMFAADAFTWLLGVVLTAVLAVGGALLASSPIWTRIDWTRFKHQWTRVKHHATRQWMRFTSLRGSRPPR